MKDFFFFLLIIIFLFENCEQTESRAPINSYKKNFLTQSVNRNKKIYRKEEMDFINLIEKDSLSQYILSNKGYWFKILKSSKKIETQIW